MKISEMTNDQASNVLIRISQPMANIMDDQNIEPLFKAITESKDMTLAKMIGNLLPKFVTFAIKDHKADLYEIIGAFVEKPAKAVGDMNIMETMKLLKDSIDKDFIDFFSSASPAEVNVGE